MAKGRGGGSSGFGSSSCEYCTEPLTLRGMNWESDKTNALFAFRIIAVVVSLVCLGLMTRFKWTRANGARDRLRSVGFFIALVSVIIYLIFTISDTALKEERTHTIYLYYLTYIFSNLFSRIYDILILATILRTVSSFTTYKLTIPNTISLVILTLITTAAMGMYAAEIGYIFTGDFTDIDTPFLKVSIAYAAVYLVVVIYAWCMGVLGFVKERSKAAVLTIGVIIPATFLSTLINLADLANYYVVNKRYLEDYYYDIPKSAIDLDWAASYIYVFALIIVNLGLAIVGCLGPKVFAYGSDQQQPKIEGNVANHPGYQAYNPGYGQPGYAQPVYVQPGYGQPGYGQPGYGQPGYEPPNPAHAQPIQVPNYN